MASATSLGVKNISKVEVKWENSDAYREVVESIVTDTYSEDKRSTLQYPSYTVRNNTIVLFPTPTENVTGGVVVYGEKLLADISVTSTENDFFLNPTLRPYVQLIADGLCVDLYAKNRQYDDMNMAQGELDRNISKMIKSIGDSVNEI